MSYSLRRLLAVQISSKSFGYEIGEEDLRFTVIRIKCFLLMLILHETQRNANMTKKSCETVCFDKIDYCFIVNACQSRGSRIYSCIIWELPKLNYSFYSFKTYPSFCISTMNRSGELLCLLGDDSAKDSVDILSKRTS